MGMGGKQPPPFWKFLTFTQNFGLQPGTAFSHAWSLCIEEQFYLVLPLVLLLGLRVGSHRAQAWFTLGALLFLGIASRIVLWKTYGREAFGQIEGYYPHVYYSTLCRFDEFLPGVAIALLKNFHVPVWQRLVQRGQFLFLAGLAATGVVLFLAYQFNYIEGYGYGFFMSAFGYSLIALAFALLVMAALSPNSTLHRIRIPGAHSLALWSYSIYLSHKPVAHILQVQTKQLALSPVTTFIGIAIASVLAGAILYRLVESPFLVIRERFFPSNFALST